MIDVLIPTCNQYIKYIEALQFSIQLFWPDYEKYKFIILGYEKPKFELESSFSFVSLGEQKGPEYWSTDLIEFLKTYDKTHFIYGNDDCCLTYMNKNIYHIALLKCFQDKTVGRFALMPEGKSLPKEIINESDQYHIYNFNNDNEYRLSLGWSIFNKEFFLQFCQPGMTPWVFEKSSCGGESRQSITDNWKVLTTVPRAILDAAFFARKDKPHPIEDWDKGYYGHDLKGAYKKLIGEIIHKL